MESRRSRIRRDHLAILKAMEVHWSFTEDQYDSFQDFFAVTLKQGEYAFTMSTMEKTANSAGEIEDTEITRVYAFFNATYSFSVSDNLVAVDATLLVVEELDTPAQPDSDTADSDSDADSVPPGDDSEPGTDSDDSDFDVGDDSDGAGGPGSGWRYGFPGLIEVPGMTGYLIRYHTRTVTLTYHYVTSGTLYGAIERTGSYTYTEYTDPVTGDVTVIEDSPLYSGGSGNGAGMTEAKFLAHIDTIVARENIQLPVAPLSYYGDNCVGLPGIGCGYTVSTLLAWILGQEEHISSGTVTSNKVPSATCSIPNNYTFRHASSYVLDYLDTFFDPDRTFFGQEDFSISIDQSGEFTVDTL